MPRPSSRPSRDNLVAVLRRCGTVEKTAETLGVHRVTLQNWMRDLGIRREWVADEEGAKSAG